MGNLLLALIYVSLFALSSRFLLGALTQTIFSIEGSREYSLSARKIEKFYKVVAWATSTVFLFFALLHSFIEIFL